MRSRRGAGPPHSRAGLQEGRVLVLFQAAPCWHLVTGGAGSRYGSALTSLPFAWPGEPSALIAYFPSSSYSQPSVLCPMFMGHLGLLPMGFLLKYFARLLFFLYHFLRKSLFFHSEYSEYQSLPGACYKDFLPLCRIGFHHSNISSSVVVHLFSLGVFYRPSEIEVGSYILF